jgi:hypothetical protein
VPSRATRCRLPWRDAMRSGWFATDILGPVGALASSAVSLSPDTSPRGIKRSRSPDTYGDLPAEDNFGEEGMLMSHARRPSPLLREASARGRSARALLTTIYCDRRLETTKTRSPDKIDQAFCWRAREP